jgi:hypothetical protein
MTLQPNEVKTEHIANGAVTTPKIADESVTTAKLKDGAVKTEKIATGAVTGSKIGEAQIYGSKLRDGAVRSEKIAAGAVTTAKIGELQVTGSRLQDKAVTTEKLANNAVTTEKIANGSVTPAKLSFTPPSITRPITPPLSGVEIADGAVTKSKLAADIASYVPRKAAVADKQKSDFAWDNQMHANGLDLSGIVPAGTKAVVLLVDLARATGNTALGIGPDMAGSPVTSSFNWVTEQRTEDDKCWVLPIDSDRLMDYSLGPNEPDFVEVTVIGYFI